MGGLKKILKLMGMWYRKRLGNTAIDYYNMSKYIIIITIIIMACLM